IFYKQNVSTVLNHIVAGTRRQASEVKHKKKNCNKPSSTAPNSTTSLLCNSVVPGRLRVRGMTRTLSHCHWGINFIVAEIDVVWWLRRRKAVADVAVQAGD